MVPVFVFFVRAEDLGRFAHSDLVPFSSQQCLFCMWASEASFKERTT